MLKKPDTRKSQVYGVQKTERIHKLDTSSLVINGADAFPEDIFVGSYMTGGTNAGVPILEPTFKPGTLLALTQQNNALGQCVAAMEVNIDGTGHSIDLIEGETEDETEKKRLEGFFREPYPSQSMITIRRRLRRDLESTGNGYLEALRNIKDEVMMINFLESDYIRLIRYDDPVQVDRVVTREGKEISVKIRTRERRYVMLVNGKKTYFKEFGASRTVNRNTGEWFKDGEKPKIEDIGSEIIHFTVNREPKTPYGAPRWLNQLPSVLGSRKAEEFNLEFFDAGGLPPVLIMIQGGYLGDEVKQDLMRHLNDKSNKHRAIVVEALSSSGSMDSSGSVQVKVERFGCVDDQTEVLTPAGWILIKDWNTGKVATVINGVMEYQDPLKYHVYDYEGDLIHIEGNATEFMVTPTHRVWYQQPRDKAMRFEFASRSVQRSNLVVPVSPVLGLSAEFHLNFIVGEKEYSQDTWLDFLGMFIADGSTTGHDSNPNTIIITVKKERKKEFLTSFMSVIASESGAKYTVNDYDDGYQRFSLYDKTLRDWLRETVGAKASEKCIPQQFLELNQVQSERLLHALLQGDGHFNEGEGKNGWTYTTVSPRLADDVQTLALHSGYRSILTKVKGREEYCISITPKSFAHVTKGKCPAWRLVPYTGKVYCFTMGTSVFITRRNGKVCITGNSDRMSDAMFQNYDKNCEDHIRTSFRLPPMFVGKAQDYNFATAYTGYMVAEAQVFFPERDEFDAIINNTVVKALGARKYRFRSLPLTLINVENQLKAISMVDGKDINGEEKVSILNEITGLSMEFEKQEESPPPQGKIDEKTGLPFDKPTPPPPSPDETATAEAEKEKARQEALEDAQAQREHELALAQAKKDALAKKADMTTNLIALADKWSVMLGLSGSVSTLTPEDEIAVKKEVSQLSGTDLKNFNELIAAGSLVMMHVDTEGLGELAGCATHLQ